MTRQLDLALYTAPAGTRLDARTNQAVDASVSWNLQGAERLSGNLPLSLPAAFRLTDTPGTLHEQLNDGAGILWEGRLENPTLTDEGSTLETLGYSRALADLPYAALWSDTSTERWRELTTQDNAAFPSEKYRFDTQNRLHIAAQKGESFSNAILGAFGYATPNGGGRQVVGMAFDYAFLAPVNWQMLVQRRSSVWVSVATDLAVNATGALITGSRAYAMTATDNLSFGLFYNAAAAVYGGETEALYITITNIRVVTSITNMIATALTVNRGAGVNVTATVGSTARMYVGQRLSVVGAGGSESVIVISIGGATTFNATFVNAYVIGDDISAHVIYSDEVVANLVSTINAVNSTQLSSGTALIQSPGRDLPDAQWLDAYGADVLADLVQRGDSQTPPRRWVWSVEIGRLLRFAPLGDGGRTWYVDAASITVQLSRENLFNDAYTVYQDAAGQALRTAVNPSTTSVARYGLTRRQMVSVSGSNALQANAARDTAITQGAYPPPKVQVHFDAVYDGSGGRWPLYLIRPGDTLFIRNLPPTLSTTVDQIRSFVIARVEYHLDDDTISVEPLDPLPTLEAALVG